MAFTNPFPSPNFQPMIPAQTGTGLVPAALYKAKFYAAGTDIPKTIYTNAGLTVAYPSPSNIAVLDDEGKALIYLGAGGYKLVLTDPNNNPVPGWTIDNIVGVGSFSTGFAASFEALKDVNTTLNTYTYVAGYYLPGDGGEGMFYNATSGLSPDGGYVQESDFDPTKKWFRIPDENGDVRAASFGYCGAGVKTSNLLAADAYAASIFARLRIQKDSTTCATITIASDIVFNSYAPLNASGTATIICNGVITAGGWDLFSSWNSVTLSNNQESRPEWLGATLSGTGAANATAFTKWKNAGAGYFVVPPGTWPHTGTFTPVSNRITIFMGSVGAVLQGTFYGPASLLSGNLSLTLTGTYGFTGNVTITGNVNQTGNSVITGAFSVIGEVTVDGNITCYHSISGSDIFGANIESTGNVIAGSGLGAGYLSAKAGTSSRNFKAAGSGNIVRGSGDATLEANALTATDDYIKIICGGTTAVTNPTFTVTVGGQTVFTNSTLKAASGTNTYRIEVLVFRTGATTSFSLGTVSLTAGSSDPAQVIITSACDTQTAGITWGSSNIVNHNTPSGVAKLLTMYEIYPAT